MSENVIVLRRMLLSGHNGKRNSWDVVVSLNDLAIVLRYKEK